MPTNGNQVKFQYIETTAPISYNTDTIYFDNINGNIKVGSTVVAEKNEALTITMPWLGSSTVGTTITKNSVTNNFGEIANYSPFWLRLINAAENGNNINIQAITNNDSILNFNNYYYNIDSGENLNFCCTSFAGGVVGVFSVNFDMIATTVMQYSKTI